MQEEKQKIQLDNRTILITGAAGFIGSALVKRLCESHTGITVIGIDCMTDYNPIALKEWRLERCRQAVTADIGNRFIFLKESISDRETLKEAFDRYEPEIVVNLAAQAGVRYSLENTEAYVETNLIGMMNILECCRNMGGGIKHLVYASSSSVYGGNKKVPFSVEDRVDEPVSLYAATKRCDELLAFSYAKLYDIPSTGLRFFTVYGPAGRTDMAYFSFTEKLRRNGTINIFNYSNCRRDFTYVDDITEGILRVMQGAPVKKQGEDGLPIAPHSLYNIGGGHPENLMDFVRILTEALKEHGILERSFSLEEHINLMGMQPGDVPVTYADSSALERDFGFRPGVDLKTGLNRFADWYKKSITVYKD